MIIDNTIYYATIYLLTAKSKTFRCIVDFYNYAERQTGKKMKLKDAAAYLRVSSRKVSKLINEGALKCESDRLDKRIKLIRMEELDKLKLASLEKD